MARASSCNSLLSSCCSFFFSSRRRHTRCLSDWSSDVCSSDLLDSAIGMLPGKVIDLDKEAIDRSLERHRTMSESLEVAIAGHEPGHFEMHERSEERRVGKECRSRWTTYH